MIEGARLAQLHLGFMGGRSGAREELESYLRAHWAVGDRPSELRFLLRVVTDARLSECVHDPLAEAFRGLTPIWPGDGPSLHDVCAAVAGASLSDACSLAKGSGYAVPFARKLALRLLQKARFADELHPVLRCTAHDVASAVGRASDPEQRSRARAAVYRKVLVPFGRTFTSIPIRGDLPEAMRLIELLVDDLQILELRPDVVREPLASRLVPILFEPLSTRPATLERLLLEDPDVEDLYARQADLARVISAWG